MLCWTWLCWTAYAVSYITKYYAYVTLNVFVFNLYHILLHEIWKFDIYVFFFIKVWKWRFVLIYIYILFINSYLLCRWNLTFNYCCSCFSYFFYRIRKCKHSLLVRTSIYVRYHPFFYENRSTIYLIIFRWFQNFNISKIFTHIFLNNNLTTVSYTHLTLPTILLV